MKPSFHDPHQFVPSRSSPEVKHFQLTRKPREEKRNEIRFRPPQFISSYTYTHVHLHAYIVRFNSLIQGIGSVTRTPVSRRASAL